MKKLAIVFIGFFLIAFSMNVNAQENPESTASANSAATIITPILIEQVVGKDLLFGNIIADANGGTVTIALDGTSSEDGIDRPTVVGNISQAQFEVTGLAGTAFDFQIPETLTLEDEAEVGVDMPVAVTHDAQGTLDATEGNEIINIGGTLSVGANQAAGTYSTTFNVVVNYN